MSRNVSKDSLNGVANKKNKKTKKQTGLSGSWFKLPNGGTVIALILN